jgi:D-alanyl-D-alanine carboxypeptidase (penicillin-binding protein 5/6)
VPTGRYKDLKAQIVFNGAIKAPVMKGQSYGAIKITLNGKELISRPLIALNDNPKGGIWNRVRDYTLLMFHKKS